MCVYICVVCVLYVHVCSMCAYTYTYIVVCVLLWCVVYIHDYQCVYSYSSIMSESNSTNNQQQTANKPPAANIIVQPQQVAQLPNAVGNPNIRYFINY